MIGETTARRSLEPIGQNPALEAGSKEQGISKFDLLSYSEVDVRDASGLRVRLLRNGDTGKLAVYAHNSGTGEEVKFPVDPSEALDAFHHPYAYEGALDTKQTRAMGRDIKVALAAEEKVVTTLQSELAAEYEGVPFKKLSDDYSEKKKERDYQENRGSFEQAARDEVAALNIKLYAMGNLLLDRAEDISQVTSWADIGIPMTDPSEAVPEVVEQERRVGAVAYSSGSSHTFYR